VRKEAWPEAAEWVDRLRFVRGLRRV
jgi:hypothetical protein